VTVRDLQVDWQVTVSANEYIYMCIIERLPSDYSKLHVRARGYYWGCRKEAREG